MNQRTQGQGQGQRSSSMSSSTSVAQRPPATPGADSVKPLPGNSLVVKFADRFGVDPTKMVATLRATAFKTGRNDPEVTNEQMVSLLVVADQYKLNPFTKEIYAFVDQKGGVIPVLGVDGWIRMMNEHPQHASVEFLDGEFGDRAPKWIDVTIVRKDREKPITVREYFAECYRNTGPWNSHPSRMLRHKALIQCIRVAYGFAGLYDPDEAERIRDARTIDVDPLPIGKPQTEAPKAREGATPAKVNGEQITELKKAVDKHGFQESAVLARYQVGAFDELTFDQAQDALEWISANAP